MVSRKPALLEEAAAAPGGAGALAAEILRRVDRPGPLLWVQDYASRRETGRPCWTGIRQITGRRVLYVAVSRAVDVLRVMEEGASCQELAAVIGEIHGAPKALDFVATKRLKLRAEAAGVPVRILRSENTGLSAARSRWHVSALPSAVHPHDPAAPGAPHWRLEVLRSATGKPGSWVAGHDGIVHRDPKTAGAADHLPLVPRPRDGALAQGGRAKGAEAAR
ncbi:MAG: hypothetical protein AAGG56_01110 [Pseudomonadota bacterium]